MSLATYTFQARVDAGQPTSTLQNTATVRAFWPNTDQLVAADKQRFTSREQTVTVTATVRVDPALAAGDDVTRPWTVLNAVRTEQTAGQAEVALRISAADDAKRMYLREWIPDPTSGEWRVARSSGWIDYSPSYSWTLSAGQGVKYLGAWVADASGNVSVFDEAGMCAVNRVDDTQTLAAGQRIQYRGDEEQGTLVIAYLTTVTGDPDIYAWAPFNAFRPDLASDQDVGPGGTEDLGGRELQRSGRFLLEVHAAGPSEYSLSVAGFKAQSARAAGMAVRSDKPRPQHPLLVSDPLSAGELGPTPAVVTKLYLPTISRDE